MESYLQKLDKQKENYNHNYIDIDERELNYVDVMKFVFAFLIVALHKNPLTSINLDANFFIVNYIARLAVPFYFIASGYFLFRKTNYKEFDFTVILKYAWRIYKLYLIWTVIYMYPIIKNQILINQNGIIHGILVWIRDFIFSGSYFHLWYLNATVFAVLLVGISIKKKMKVRNIIILASVFYGIGLFEQAYFGLILPLEKYTCIWSFFEVLQKIIVTTRNGLFEGFLFISLGMLFAYKPIKLKKKKAIGLFIISMILFFIEVIIIKKLGWFRGKDMYIFLVPTSFLLFHITLQIELKENSIYKELRKIGSLIFYLHMWGAIVVGKIMNCIGVAIGMEFNNSLIRYIIIVLLTSCMAVSIRYLSNKKRFRLLNRIY